jgi:hypothetical protein
VLDSSEDTMNRELRRGGGALEFTIYRVFGVLLFGSQHAGRIRMDRREFLQTTGIRAGYVVLQGTVMALAQGDADQFTDCQPACSCGTLLGAIDLPYLRDPQTGLYALSLCPRVAVRGAICFFCGAEKGDRHHNQQRFDVRTDTTCCGASPLFQPVPSGRSARGHLLLLWC